MDATLKPARTQSTQPAPACRSPFLTSSTMFTHLLVGSLERRAHLTFTGTESQLTPPRLSWTTAHSVCGPAESGAA